MSRVFTFTFQGHSGVFVYNPKSKSIATITYGSLDFFNKNMVGYPGTTDAIVSMRPVDPNRVWCVVHGFLPEIKKFVQNDDYFRQHFSSTHGSIEHLFEMVSPFFVGERVSIELNEVKSKSRKSLKNILLDLVNPTAVALYFGFEN